MQPGISPSQRLATRIATLLACLAYTVVLVFVSADEPALQNDEKRLWSLQPLMQVGPPMVRADDWCENSVDRFILAQLEKNDIAPNDAASRRTLIRRLAFDLVGLPPAPDAIDSFLADGSPAAYERLVDRLLTAPGFGERWARHWLDVARFAESYGFEHDFDIDYAYHYRDFVIEALNEDMPYNRFAGLQVAGDELEPDNRLAWMATGFLTAGVHNWAYAQVQVEPERYNELDDMVSTLGSAMLGLTIGCARCHDHKFDPISQEDYYRLVAAFGKTVRSEAELDFDPEWYAKAKPIFDRDHAPLVAARERYEKEELPRRLEKWITTGSELPMPDWLVLDGLDATSTGGAKLTRLDDGSYLASGDNPTNDDFVMTTETSLRGIRYVRLQALADRSMPHRGPGRTSNGNFVLTEMRLKTQPLTGDAAPTVARWKKGARDTFHQNGLTGAGAVDNDPGGGWAIFPKVGVDQALIAELEEPVGFEGGTRLIFELEFRFGGQHVIGRPRLSIGLGTPSRTGSELTVPDFDSEETLHEFFNEVNALLKSSPENLTAEQKATVSQVFRYVDPGWQRLDQIVRDHLEHEPQPDIRKVLVASEGLEPHRIYDPRPAFYEETYFLEGGDTQRKRGVQKAAVPAALVSSSRDRSILTAAGNARTSGRRSAVASWMTDPTDGVGHLLARVIVNRLWHYYFGCGLVATPSDFGHQGDLPSHPELLDWLARELIRHDWRLKPIHRIIVTSATYRQSASHDADRDRVDPQNLLLWRHPVLRLEGEVIRDAMLEAGASLEQQLFGKGTLDENMRRRSIYFTVKRSLPIPLLALFDAPDGLVTIDKRPTSTVAPQALALMNNEHVRRFARDFAQRVMTSSEPSADSRIERAYLLALGRPPAAAEKADAVRLLARSNNEQALVDLCHALYCLNEFLYIE
jgi:hypothetical protein